MATIRLSRGFLVRPGQVDAAIEDRDWMATGSGSGYCCADLAAGGTRRRRLLGPAGVAGLEQLRDRGLRAVRNTLQRGRKSGRSRYRDPGEILIPVCTGNVQGERRMLAGALVGHPGSERGPNGRVAPGHGEPFGPDVSVKNWVDVCSASAASQGVKVLSTGYVPQRFGVASRLLSDPKKCILKSENGNCGRFSKVVVRRPVTGSAWTVPGNLTWTPKPFATNQSRYGRPGRGRVDKRSPAEFPATKRW